MLWFRPLMKSLTVLLRNPADGAELVHGQISLLEKFQDSVLCHFADGHGFHRLFSSEDVSFPVVGNLAPAR